MKKMAKSVLKNPEKALETKVAVETALQPIKT